MDTLDTMADFRANIKDELDLCSEGATPWVCANISTPDGYKKVEKLVMELVLQEKIGIGMAITQVEDMFNPGALD